MSEGTGLLPGDPLNGSAIVGRWSFGYDMPDELRRWLRLRRTAAAQRRHSAAPLRRRVLPRRAGHLEIPAMGRSALVDRRNGPKQAMAILKLRGYDLLKHDPVPIDTSTFGPIPGTPSASEPL